MKNEFASKDIRGIMLQKTGEEDVPGSQSYSHKVSSEDRIQK